MVVVLHYKFFHLRDCVISSSRHVLGDIWYLSPYYKAEFITERVEVLVMLIMRQSHCVGSHLHNKSHVLIVVFLRYCVSLSPSVLMTRDTPEWILFSIKNKASFTVDYIASETNIYRDSIFLYAPTY